MMLVQNRFENHKKGQKSAEQIPRWPQMLALSSDLFTRGVIRQARRAAARKLEHAQRKTGSQPPLGRTRAGK